MAPLIWELRRRPGRVEVVTCVTGQHRQMLDQVLDLFRIQPDVDLDLMRDNQSLPSLTGALIERITGVMREAKPDVTLVQGDTTTAMAGALAAFYQQVCVGHVEAGLRSGRRDRPFPEEVNRRLISELADYHFAPTATAVRALRNEGIAPEQIFLTGNTVVDALLQMIEYPHAGPRCGFADDRRLILVTTHRRENFGAPLEEICLAIGDLVRRHPDVEVACPVHLNPRVQSVVRRHLEGNARVHLLPPLDYLDFLHLLKRCHLVVTDSGGIQEEAPALGKPVLVLRTETERPEAVEAGIVRLVGTDRARIVAEASRLLDDSAAYGEMARAVSPYGDGHAAERIVDILLAQAAVRRDG
jgi:UDP-N-acetylglucosamine 2-epimerase (non-hydrolysing)